MVVVEIGGLIFSSTKVFFNSLVNSINQAIAINAPNGNIFQKIGGSIFGIQYTTEMVRGEALEILGFETSEKPDFQTVRQRLDQMLKINDLSKGGSPFLNERFIASAHIIIKNK